VSQVKDFYQMFVLPKLVIDQNWAVRQFSHPSSLTDCAAHAWESRQQVHMVEQGIAKAPRGVSIVFGNAADDFSEVV
jgi:hypothetical protein